MPRDAFGRLAHARLLHRMGFKRDGWCEDPLFYVKRLTTPHGMRLIRVQLWKNGRHLVSHSLDGRSTTKPTEFMTVHEMCLAIKVEETRLDQTTVEEAVA